MQILVQRETGDEPGNGRRVSSSDQWHSSVGHGAREGLKKFQVRLQRPLALRVVFFAPGDPESRGKVADFWHLHEAVDGRGTPPLPRDGGKSIEISGNKCSVAFHKLYGSGNLGRTGWVPGIIGDGRVQERVEKFLGMRDQQLPGF